ncbi:helicase HerA domain-containing protein [Curtobacterium flaccumfaciens]|uniref:helicase HerA domain-containing protein n=1 Tax=Curtobacterium flaccumfaciens TaxID=2035 RepID=UPI0013761C32|nr:DUF87 domain-containing protein [Curtobacterium flaccumfaciens]
MGNTTMSTLVPGIANGSTLEQTLLAAGRATRIGAIQRMDYHEAIVLTHDKWKEAAGGIPQFSYLLATARNPSAPHDDDDEVLLLRVEGTAPLSLESDLHAVREESLRTALTRAANPQPSTVLDVEMDPFTRDRAAFTGLRCRVLGTFYEEDINGTRVLQFGSDVDNFYATSTYRVLKPAGAGLAAIASFTRPERGTPDLVPLGHVRYSATRRRAISSGQVAAPVEVNMDDFIGHKTGLLGMTRSGKSNTAKILIARTFVASERRRAAGKAPIGQLIFDPQGEYANPNTQDGTEIAGIGAGHVRIFKFGATPSAHLKPLGINFFDPAQIELVQDFLAEELGQDSAAGYVKDFRGADFVGDGSYQGDNRASRGRLILYASLVKAGFTIPANGAVRVSMKREVKAVVDETDPNVMRPAGTGNYSIRYEDLHVVVDALLAAESAGNESVKEWISEPSWKGTEAIYTRRTSSGGAARGYQMFNEMRTFHDPNTARNVAAEIYEELLTGKIVIVDLHIGTSRIVQRMSEMITRHLLQQQTKAFTSGAEPRPIQVLLEEAHNLFSAKQYDRDDDIWVKLAKEASKLNIGMLYATQEVTGVAHQVKSNTANWVVSHLNNHSELRELSKFYDFSSFADAILASEDRGYVRLKTLSSPFVVPVQIDKYDLRLVNEARAAANLPPLPERTN